MFRRLVGYRGHEFCGSDTAGREACRTVPWLVDSDAEQAEWDEFYASVGKAFSAKSVDELASKFVELNDPATIRRVLWGYGDKWYLDSDCEYEF